MLRNWAKRDREEGTPVRLGREFPEQFPVVVGVGDLAPELRHERGGDDELVGVLAGQPAKALAT
jgi:hypothetical protein